MSGLTHSDIGLKSARSNSLVESLLVGIHVSEDNCKRTNNTDASDPRKGEEGRASEEGTNCCRGE